MKKYYAPDEAIVVDQRDLENVVTAEIREVYFASDVDAHLAGIEEADNIWHKTTRKQMEAQDARIAELQEALQEYGGHHEECAKITGGDCDCGFSKLMER